MNINPRVGKIFQELYQTKLILTSQYFSKLLGVTSRTIRQDIKTFNEQYFNGNHAIMTISGKGYQLNAKYIPKMKKIIDEKMIYQNPIEPEERIIDIKNQLFFDPKGLHIDHLIEKLYISESTLKRDVRRINEDLTQYDIRLNIQKDIKVNADESNVRRAMLDFVESRKVIYKAFDLLLQEINDFLIKEFSMDDLYLSQFKFQKLKYIIGISIYRYQLSFSIEEVRNETILDYEYKSLINNLKNAYQLNQNELMFIYKQIKEQLMQDKNLIDQVLIDQVGMIKKLNETFGMEFDDTLIQEILVLLNTKGTVEDRNLEIVKKLYPLAFEISLFMMNMISEELTIKSNKYHLYQLVYLIQDILLEKEYQHLSKKKRYIFVSHLDIYQNNYLTAKISTIFPNLKLIKVIPYYQSLELIDMDIDLIISTKTLTIKSDKVIVINQDFKSYDVLKVKSFLKHPSQVHAQFKLINHLKEMLFFTNVKLQDPFEVIEFLCEKLEQSEDISPHFMESVIKREALASTFINHFIAIPHAIDRMSGENVIAIAILEQPIMWFDHKVQMVFLLNIKNPKESHIEDMFSQLYELIDNKQLVNRLIGASNYYEYIEILNQVRMENEN